MAGAMRARSGGGISPDAAQAYFDISQMLGFNAAGVGLAVTLAATAIIALRFGAPLPRRLAIAMLVISVALLLAPTVRFAFVLAFLVLPLLSVALYRRGAAAG
jgi:hypothetical protein